MLIGGFTPQSAIAGPIPYINFTGTVSAETRRREWSRHFEEFLPALFWA